MKHIIFAAALLVVGCAKKEPKEAPVVDKNLHLDVGWKNYFPECDEKMSNKPCWTNDGWFPSANTLEFGESQIVDVGIRNEIGITNEKGEPLDPNLFSAAIPPIESNRLADVKHGDGYIDDGVLEFKTPSWGYTEIHRFVGDQMPPQYQIPTTETTEWIGYIPDGFLNVETQIRGHNETKDTYLRFKKPIEIGLVSDGTVRWRYREDK